MHLTRKNEMTKVQITTRVQETTCLKQQLSYSFGPADVALEEMTQLDVYLLIEKDLKTWLVNLTFITNIYPTIKYVLFLNVLSTNKHVTVIWNNKKLYVELLRILMHTHETQEPCYDQKNILIVDLGLTRLHHLIFIKFLKWLIISMSLWFMTTMLFSYFLMFSI
ncbi:hypothetical protein ACJX0J_010692 [Zea mays]